MVVNSRLISASTLAFRSLLAHYILPAFLLLQYLWIHFNTAEAGPFLKMQYSSTLLCAAFAVTAVYSHGVVTEVQGANSKS